MSKDTVTIDSIFKELGPFGRYNVVNYALLLFPCYLAALYGSVFNFEALDISYRCEVPQCESINETLWLQYAIPTENGEFSKCKMYQYIDGAEGCTKEAFNRSTIRECDRYVYSDDDSVVVDFDLGCQNWKRTLVGSIHNAGFFISLPLTGILSDKFGRKIAISVASLLNGICGIARSFSTSYIMFIGLEFAEAALGGGAYCTAFVLAMELVEPKGRVFGNTLINFVFVFGLMTLAGLSWWLQNWRYLLRIIYTPPLLILSYLFILNESPRWLFSKGRLQEGVDILKKAAKMNKVTIAEDKLNPQNFIKRETDEDNDDKKSFYTFMRVIKSPTIRTRLVICSYMWITCTFVYYGLSINSVSLAGNRYLNFMLVGFVEMPANAVCLLVLNRFGRKRIIIITYVLSGCLCISLSMLPKDHIWGPLILYLCGKFSITVAYSSVYIYVSEVFPTNARQSLLAICSTTGRIGSTLAPLTPLLVSQE
ncbi:organic cation transporter protein-like [Epargyreus clarus]|uniref:organic cation transporter protein-like n=1 Tax=Epargyreus clarus TaxID=520877 RepID=UPI003C30471E